MTDGGGGLAPGVCDANRRRRPEYQRRIAAKPVLGRAHSPLPREVMEHRAIQQQILTLHELVHAQIPGGHHRRHRRAGSGCPEPARRAGPAALPRINPLPLVRWSARRGRTRKSFCETGLVWRTRGRTGRTLVARGKLTMPIQCSRMLRVLQLGDWLRRHIFATTHSMRSVGARRWRSARGARWLRRPAACWHGLWR
jgi:hypothetical protein